MYGCLSHDGEAGVWDVRDEHVARRVGDHEFRLDRHGDGLRGDAARPENGHLAGTDLGGFAEVGLVDVMDADGFGVADVDGRAVNEGHAGGDLHGADGVGRLHGTHGDHHGAVEHAGGDAFDIGLVHGHIVMVRDVPHLEARLDHGRLEGEAAPEEEGHEIVPPEGGDVCHLVGELALPVDTVSGNIGADVRAGRGEARHGGARLGHVEHGAGLFIPLGEKKKIKGEVLGQNGQIGLGIAVAHAAGLSGDFAGADHGTHCSGRSFGKIHENHLRKSGIENGIEMGLQIAGVHVAGAEERRLEDLLL